MDQRVREMKVSGRMVLIAFIAFFAVIAAVNALMATLAIRTFGGVEADNAYRAGLEFAKELTAARAQQARNLTVELSTRKLPNGMVEVSLVTSGLESAASKTDATIELRHPADKRHDHVLTLRHEGNGRFVAIAAVEPGHWNARVSLFNGSERIFRSINRLSIP